VKPTAMLKDALIDLTNPGEIVLDPFLGSGSTLIAPRMPVGCAAASSSIPSTSMSLSDAMRRKQGLPLFSPTPAKPSNRSRSASRDDARSGGPHSVRVVYAALSGS